MTSTTSRPRIQKSDAEWRRELTPAQYHVTREHGTERAFTGPIGTRSAPAPMRACAAATPLFSSATKFEFRHRLAELLPAARPRRVDEHEDRSFFMRRTEVRCATCDAHLGHVFPDGPKPTGQRYCMNGTRPHLRAESDAADK